MKESKFRHISELEEHINVISFPQVTQSELARLESKTTTSESEAVHTSDEFTGKAEMTRTAKTRKDLWQLIYFDSFWNWSVFVSQNLHKLSYKQFGL